MRPDKKKVVDEVWDDERVASFLDKQPPHGEDRDFYALLTAYQSMRLDDFERFCTLFASAGRNFQAIGSNGKTLAEVAAGHRQGLPFAGVINAHASS